MIILVLQLYKNNVIYFIYTINYYVLNNKCNYTFYAFNGSIQAIHLLFSKLNINKANRVSTPYFVLINCKNLFFGR